MTKDLICYFWRKITKNCWKISTNTKKQLSLQGKMKIILIFNILKI